MTLNFVNTSTMGGAVSSNVANIVTSVTNNITSSIQTNNSFVNNCVNSQKFVNCSISKAVIKNVCNIQSILKTMTTQQIQDTLNSQVAQQLLQTAQSQVGSMGIGYAAANNLVSALVNNANVISHSITQNASSISNIYNNFACTNSQFGTLVIDNTGTISAFIDQVINQTAVDNLISNVSQDISQTATATIEGLTSFIIALAILIIAIGYVAFKPVGMIMSNKIIMITIVLFVVMSIVLFMYLKQLPPFFSPAVSCTTNTAINCCGTNVSCTTDASAAQINMSSPPLRYTFNIIGSDGTIPGSNPSGPPGLLQMVIAAQQTGWSQATFNYFNNNPILAGLPNPLVQSGVNSWITNINEWSMLTTAEQNLARFVLCNLLEIDTSVYMYDDEQCMVNGNIITSPSLDQGCMLYVPSYMPPESNIGKALTGGGVLNGQFGSCDSPTYRLQNFMKKGGFLIPVGLFGAIIAFLVFFKRGDAQPSTSK